MSVRKVFVEGENLQERAYFGWQKKDDAFYGLREGYLNSANNLVDIALDKGSQGDIKTLDTFIFPIIFLYRHSIELSLKNIYHRFYGQIPDGRHDLLVLWDNIYKKVLVKLEDQSFLEMVKKYKTTFVKFNFNGISMNEIRLMIKEINDIDLQADKFRYLMDKDAELYFINSKFIDYPNLKESMNYLYEVLDYINFVVDEYLSS